METTTKVVKVNRVNRGELAQLQGLPLELKILKTQQRIREWYEAHDGEVYISFSGGKDSTVLLDLVRSVYSDVVAVYVDTGLEYPEVRNFVKTIPNVKWIKPKMRFDQVIEKYGYPIISKEQAQFIRQYKTAKSEKTKKTRIEGNKWGRGKISKKWQFLLNEDVKISDQCCDKIKKQPVKTFEKETGLKPFIGNMAVESMKREQDYMKFGCNAFGCDRPISRPIGFWTEQDVLQYLYDKELPYASCYGGIMKDNNEEFSLTGIKRSGCMFCAFGCHLETEPNRFQKMKLTHPKQWNYCINTLEMRKALDLINVKYE